MPTKRTNLTLSPEATAILNEKPNKSRFASEAIIAYADIDRMEDYKRLARKYQATTSELQELRKDWEDLI